MQSYIKELYVPTVVQARVRTPQDHRNVIFVTPRSAGVLGRRTGTPVLHAYCILYTVFRSHAGKN